MRGTGGQRELQAERYTAVEDSVLRLIRELMHERLTPKEHDVQSVELGSGVVPKENLSCSNSSCSG